MQLSKTDRNPIEETEFRELLRQQEQNRPSTPSAPSTSTSSVIDMARQLAALTGQLQAPALQTLESTRPQIESTYAERGRQLTAEREPLKQRYQTLLAEITRREQVETKAQETTTSREFGRRGIPLSSGLFETTLGEQLSPLRQFYTGQTKETGLARESGLRDIENLLGNLTIGKGQEMTNLSQAIAAIQGAQAPTSIQSALSLYGQQQTAQQNALQRALQERELVEREQQNAIANALAQRQFQEVALPKSKYELEKPYYKFTPDTTGASTSLEDLWNMFNQ